MNTPINRFYVHLSPEVQDDLLALSRAFALPKLSYIDIVRQERMAQMMARWPLLAELAQTLRSK
ncbi:putative cytoplasmic protein [Yersinia nurmii]|uniref:Cytoplasmic protein n=1 Tax=Yersinia nurmii TaxID=685706 RepID=A0ABM9S608_9GAMM|nr:cellulose biosynthesis protein BcsR [Yersinia nurmii]CNE26770.1 putative cytoplasmic protein [Yersinia nurmii]